MEEYKVNRVFVSIQTHHICGKCILLRVEIHKPLDRSVSLVVHQLSSSLADRTTKIHHRRSDSSDTIGQEC